MSRADTLQTARVHSGPARTIGRAWCRLRGHELDCIRSRFL